MVSSRQIRITGDLHGHSIDSGPSACRVPHHVHFAGDGLREARRIQECVARRGDRLHAVAVRYVLRRQPPVFGRREIRIGGGSLRLHLPADHAHLLERDERRYRGTQTLAEARIPADDRADVAQASSAYGATTGFAGPHKGRVASHPHQHRRRFVRRILAFRRIAKWACLPSMALPIRNKSRAFATHSRSRTSGIHHRGAHGARREHAHLLNYRGAPAGRYGAFHFLRLLQLRKAIEMWLVIAICFDDLI